MNKFFRNIICWTVSYTFFLPIFIGMLINGPANKFFDWFWGPYIELHLKFVDWTWKGYEDEE